MAQVFDPVPSDGEGKITCCYVNATSKMQIARITNIPNWYFERVVFPGQHLVFEAMSSAQLEIHTGMMASSILSDTISCSRLRLQETPASAATKEAPDSSPASLYSEAVTLPADDTILLRAID
ncbi:DUF1830 domain-containing protein [Leptolyngbya sp. FACHB-261]|uniref:DUF1830 domain-containing protein n=1 Tax=Leptolyngbya sp. FACHB-261 TaxID=2692806 RepID=UPI00168A2C97|nr:DUF1830 domain-containing protein [Leptolyngbya sp. FACHB-261]MBD2102353.1 DUF1830 domain-containing protein [Leptolyngbya sp. FACHB-261]